MKIKRGKGLHLPDVKRCSEFELQQVYSFTKTNPPPPDPQPRYKCIANCALGVILSSSTPE